MGNQVVSIYNFNLYDGRVTVLPVISYIIAIAMNCWLGFRQVLILQIITDNDPLQVKQQY